MISIKFTNVFKQTLMAVLMIIATSGTLMAQSYKVTGTVKDTKTGEPIPFVNVALCRTTDTLFMRGATTDFDEGRFEIEDVQAREYLLFVSYVGYQRIYRPVTITGNTDLGTISLAPSALGGNLAEVHITTDRPIFSMDGEKNIYNTSDDPGVQTGTASDALQNAPGIEIDADGNITLRGTQSVDVWINDRPSHMDGEALKQYIKMLPANSIERIEVISNPSARYGGGTPVVNIITTQKIQRNEFVSIGLNGSSRPDQNIWLSEAKPWVSYVFANEKLNFNIYANFGYNKRESEYHGQNTSFVDHNGKLDTVRYTNYTSTEENEGIESYIGGHLSYTFDKRNSLGSWYGCYPSWRNQSEWGRSERYDYVYDNDGNLLSIIDNTYEGTEDKPMRNKPNGGGYFGGWYEHKFDDSTGHKINLSMNGNGYWTREYNHHERHYTIFPTNDIVRNVDSYSRWTNMSMSADYTLPFGGQDTLTRRFFNELDLGLSFDNGGSRNWNYSTWESMGYLAGKTDSIDNDSWNRHHDISLYGTYQRRFGNFTAKLGLREEIAMQSIDYYLTPEHSLDSTFFTLTPSLHLSYSTKTMHNFSFSYTRRVNQPGVSSLTIHKTYDLDNYGNWGNPELRPEYSQKIELQWDKYFVKFGSIGAQLYYSSSTDKESSLTNVTWSDYYGAVVRYTQPMNIGNSYTAGLDINTTYRPTAFLNVRFSGSLIYDNEDFTFNGQHYTNDHPWSYRFRLNAWAKLWKNYQFFVNAHYGSPTKSIFTTNSAHKGVDVGVNADFFDRKMTVNLNIHDIFNISSWDSSNDNPFYSSTGSWKPMSRYITLGLTVRFGKMELEGMAQQSGGESMSTPSQL